MIRYADVVLVMDGDEMVYRKGLVALKKEMMVSMGLSSERVILLNQGHWLQKATFD